MNLINKYSEYYENKEIKNLYPTEFVVRAFLGSNGIFKNINNKISNNVLRKSVLDLGFGDGRNIPFLSNLGMKVFGLEISQKIVNNCKLFLENNGYYPTLSVGTNEQTFFKANSFDFVLGCHSIYYISKGKTFEDNVNEIFRILKKNGHLIFSIPDKSSYIVKNSKKLPDGYVSILNDPLKIRNGSIIKYFDSKNDIVDYFKPYSKDIKIGKCFNDWWGLNEHAWTVICSKK